MSAVLGALSAELDAAVVAVTRAEKSRDNCDAETEELTLVARSILDADLGGGAEARKLRLRALEATGHLSEAHPMVRRAVEMMAL